MIEKKKRADYEREIAELTSERDRYKVALLEIARIGNKLDIGIANQALSPVGDTPITGLTGGMYDEQADMD